MKKISTVIVAMLVCASASAGWVYDDSTDKMTGKKTSTASIESNNSLSLAFPYQGKNFGNILVRQHPSYGLNVIFYVDKGQILCRSYAGCSVTVRFDDKPPMKFEANGSEDNDPKVIFLKGASRFIEAAKKAKTILVQVTMYQSGAPVLEFHSASPLDWAAPKPARPAAAKTAPPKAAVVKSEPVNAWPAVPETLNGNR
ncbi:hypothetical protein [Polaromonas sp. CG_23.6]|uniref:hypothetical protein n=1 Tax=Polaromonas sp. CG_23.6 TaxID=2760709 RepID=UPI0024772789|nr:hypothetical protein [Polaromonas sp. CG_23.6]MDH6185504.1 hypothetical protein [Polaromonas sp. CG_23.6]